MTELPPAVAKYIADAEPFVRGTNKAVEQAKRFGRDADKAALSARKMGQQAKEAGEKAAIAGKVAAEAAEKAAKGLMKEERAAELAARAVRELERAELKRAAAALATAGASDKAAKSHRAHAEAARSLAQDAEQSGELIARSFTSAGASASSALSGIGVSGPAALGLVAAALVALPIAATAAGGALTVGLGGSLVSLGLYASRGSQKVKAELTGLKEHVKSEATRIARPFEKVWITVAREAGHAFDLVAPTIEASLVRLAPSVQRFARHGALSLAQLTPAIAGVERAFSAVLDDLGPRLPAIMDTISRAVTEVTSAVERNPQAIGDMVQALATLVEWGGQAVAMLIDLAAWMSQNSQVLAAVFHAIPGMSMLGDAVEAMGQAQQAAAVQGAQMAYAHRNAAAAAVTQRSAQAELNGVMSNGRSTADQLKAALDRLTGANQSADEANIAFRNATASASAAVKEHGRGLSLNTQRGRDNRSALLEVARAAQAHITAMRNAGASQAATNAAASRARARFIALAQSMGASSSEAKRLADRILGIPNKTVKVRADTAQAWGAIGSLISRVNALPSGKTVTVTYVQRGPGLSPVMPSYGKLLGRAAGGIVDGPGTETSDSIPAWLSKNEYVINAKQTRRYLPIIEAINAGTYASGGLVGYARGGRVTRVGGVDVSTTQWRNLGLMLGKDFMKGMTGSTAEIAAMDRRLEKTVAKLFGGKRTQLDNKLIRYLDRNSERLQDLSERRARAKEGLKEGRQYAATLTSNARSFAGLSGLDGPTSGAQIRQGLTMKLSSLTRYASVIKSLSKRGLSKSLLRQVLDMGPEEGLKYGEMLLAADKGTFKDINAVQKQIDRTSASFGRSGADILYDAGKMAGKGFLTGLNAELKRLDKTMDRLALRMSRAIKRSLHIKSPSQLPALRQAGAMTVAGVAAGMDANLGVLDQSAARMAARLGRAPAAPRPVMRAPSVPLSGRGAVVQQVVHVHVAGSVWAEKELFGVVQRQALQHNRRNTSNGLSLAGAR